MKKLKKVIAGVAAVAALVAVPTATAVAETVSDSTETNSATYNMSSTHLVMELEVNGYSVDVNAARSDSGATVSVTDIDEINGHITGVRWGNVKVAPEYMTPTSSDKCSKTYTLEVTDGSKTETYTVTFTQSDCSTDDDTTYMLTSMTVSGMVVKFDNGTTTGSVTSSMCPEYRNFENVSADLPDGYQLKYYDQTGDTSDDTVVVKYALQTESSLTGAWTTVAYYTVTFNFVDQETCSTDTGDDDNTGDDNTGDENTGDDTTGDDENTGDDTTDGDDTVDEDDTTGDAENPSDDESDTDDTDDTEATSDEESESDDTSTLATTGSALLGIGVFALVALIGAGVVYTVRKRA